VPTAPFGIREPVDEGKSSEHCELVVPTEVGDDGRIVEAGIAQQRDPTLAGSRSTPDDANHRATCTTPSRRTSAVDRRSIAT
jgi:hypothetical protein